MRRSIKVILINYVDSADDRDDGDNEKDFGTDRNDDDDGYDDDGYDDEDDDDDDHARCCCYCH